MFASLHGYEFTKMLTKASQDKWLVKIKEGMDYEDIKAYGSHDTVCMIAKDMDGSMASGTSTSGLFMKQPGRIGDRPVIGSGFYCDSAVGGACATGVGEDIMKGCLSCKIVTMMENGISCQLACEKAISNHMQKLILAGIKPGSMAVIAMDKDGGFGGATNKNDFPFVVSNELGTKLMVARIINNRHSVEEASDEWLSTYVEF